MYLSKLVINNFRNIKKIELSCENRKIYFFGDNAQGKTNILEAIYLLCLAKSFRTRDESELVYFGEESFIIEGTFIDEIGISRHIVIQYNLDSGKKIHLDGKTLHQFSKLIGLFPVVLLSSEDHAITNGPPSQRRRFFNILLSQSSSFYLESLKDYEKILKQRNKILYEIAKGRRDAIEQLEVWDTQLVQKGQVLMIQRAKIVDEMNKHLSRFYQTLTSGDKSLSIEYAPSVPFEKEADIPTDFSSMMKKVREKEFKQGTTLVGPHRDEFIFTINKIDLRKYGSRGEHKSVLLSLKTVESILLRQKTEREPILLLDDLYSELDKSRASRSIEMFPQQAQTFITGTSSDFETMKSIIDQDEGAAVYFIKEGQVYQN